jgi:hypothetical protein
VSEIIGLGCGVLLVPRGIFDRRFWRSLVAASIALARFQRAPPEQKP